MEDTNNQLPAEAPPPTPIVIKTKLEATLIKIEAGIQTLTDKEAKLVYNSDHLQDIADFISTIDKAIKKVETERVAIKKPFKDGGENVDAGAKLVSSELNNLRKKAAVKYEEMVKEQNRLKKIQDDEDARIKNIKDGMDNNIMSFSTKIAEAKDLPTLLDIERRVNLETASTKYQEFLPDFKKRCEAIRSLLSLQKQNVKKLGGLEDEAANALETGADDKLEAIEAEKDELTAKLEETRTRIQETAINQSTSSVPQRATQVFNTVKPKRQTWEWEITDMAAFAKKYPLFVELVVKKDVVDQMVTELKQKGTIQEIEKDGIKIFLKKTFI